MIMRSPIVAMLWENWRLTRIEAAQRLGLGLAAGGGALVLFDAGPAIAFWILFALHAFFWFSISKLNGGRFSDGYKPGFPLYLLFARPVSTVTFVGVAMLYDAVSCTALYVASAALLGAVFGEPLPVFSFALCLVTFHLACTCIQWATRSRIVQWSGSLVVGWPFLFLVQNRVGSPSQIHFSLVENTVMILICILSIVLAVVGVSRQRRGDAVAIVPQQKDATGGYPAWFISVFRFRCPTSSATRAQVWFELKSSGLPVLAIGVAIAILISMLFAISIAIPLARNFALGISVFSVPTVLFFLGGNVFGIRRKQGRRYASAFESTQPCGTAQLAGLKLVVRSACMLAALTVIGISVWASSSFVGGWGPWIVDGKNAAEGLLKARSTIAGKFGELPAYAYVAQAVIAFIAAAGYVAWQASREALTARYPRSALVVVGLPIVWGLAIVLLALVQKSGIAPALPVKAILQASFWIAAVALMSTTIYLFWNGISSRVLTAGYLSSAVLVIAVFAAAWVAMLHAAGAPFSRMPALHIAAILFPVMMMLMNSLLAPWSLDRIRHA
ncbi:MAG: hypothetical protein H7Y89_08990 [Steroidobacteraceae bacterium]|nr:hypothetical protein [Steroidobacteraceae bacterium]